MSKRNKEPKQTLNTIIETQKKIDPNPVNLTTIRETSQSSEEGRSKKETKKQNKVKKGSKNEQKTIIDDIRVIRQDPKEESKEQQVVYDQYNILKISGLLDAYENFLKLLCKNGLPTGKVFDYAAQQIERYQKHKINKELKMRAQLDIQKIAKRSQLSQSPAARQISASPNYEKNH